MKRASLIPFLFLVLLAAGRPGGAEPVPALAHAPKINSVFPPGIMRGSAVEVTLAGEHLQRDSQVLVSGEGVTARVTAATSAAAEGSMAEKKAAGDATAGGTTAMSAGKAGDAPATLVVKLTAAADATPGPRELRVLGPNGASNAARVVVGALTGMIETEPNNKLEEAQALKAAPITVYGRIEPLGDVDSYRFHAGAGETWVFDLACASYGSSLDGYMTLRDASGQELATAMETLDQDPRLIHTFEAAGDYTISVRDIAYRGGLELTYCLSIGQLPTVIHVLPLALPRGETTTVQLAGVNLGGMQTMDVSVPANYSGDTMLVVPKTPAGEAAPVSLPVSTLPQWVEMEPNDDLAHANRLPSLPVAVSGVIEKKGDVDCFVFHADAGQKLTLDLFGRRLGSRIDSFLKVTDPKGKELASNDDAVGKDSRLEWTVPAAGDYIAQVSDIAGEGGDDYSYRLEITPGEAPDFKLTVTPDVTNIGPGDSETLTVRAERRNGFTGDITLRVEGLPGEVAASPGIIAAGQDSVEITLTAGPAARGEGFALRVIGSGTIAGKAVERAAEPIESYQRPGEEDRRERPAKLEVAGIGDVGPYTVSAEPRQVTLAPGGAVKITVKVARRADQADAKGELKLDVQNVPEGIDVTAPAIPADKSEGTVELKASEKLEVKFTSTNLIVRARSDDRTRPAPAVTLTLLTKPAEAPKGK